MTQLQFENALLELRKKLRFYALSLTSDAEKADDLLQETMLKALTNRDKFATDTNFKAWVYTIMKNTFINDYRKGVKSKKSFDNSSSTYQGILTIDGNEPSPDSTIGTIEIVRTISGLEDEYRIPFTMFLDGFKYKEIADELDLPLGTVKSRIFFTRKRLGKMLSEYSIHSTILCDI
jgi:RNA polymerase sigma factor (sigma-70 family)